MFFPVDNPLQIVVDRYKARIDVLEEELADLKEQLRGGSSKDVDISLNLCFGVTRLEMILLTEIMKRELASKDTLMSACYANNIDKIPAIKIIDVVVHKIRQKLKKHGVEIKTARGVGYFMKPDEKTKVRKIVADMKESMGS